MLCVAVGHFEQIENLWVFLVKAVIVNGPIWCIPIAYRHTHTDRQADRQTDRQTLLYYIMSNSLQL